MTGEHWNNIMEASEPSGAGAVVRVAETVKGLRVPATVKGLDWLLGWARNGIEQTGEPWASSAADVVEVAALDFDELEALVLGSAPEAGGRRRFRQRGRGWNPDPDRTRWKRVDASVPGHPRFVFTVQPMISGPVMTTAEQGASVAIADERRVQRAQEAARNSPGRRQRVEMDAGQREALALSLGGRRTGESVRGVTCPSCAKRSVWWFVDPVGRTWTGAACAHRQTCGWAGGFATFGGGR